MSVLSDEELFAAYVSGQAKNSDWSFQDGLRAVAKAAVAAELVGQQLVMFEDNNGAFRKRARDCQRFGADGVPAAVWIGERRYVPDPPAAPVPEGWKMVPVDLTPAMWRAGRSKVAEDIKDCLLS